MGRSLGAIAVRGLHWAIIVNFVVELAYAAYMVFFGSTPELRGPLGNRAGQLAPEKMVVRRMYAIEFWLAMAGLATYLAITVIGPSLLQDRRRQG
jgi:hypothetical protein